MKSTSMVGSFFKTFWILAASVIAVAQTQATEPQSPPQRGSEEYWLLVDELADRAVDFAHAKRFVQLHEGSLTGRQCEQYSRIAVDYRDELAAVRLVAVSAESEFWNDVHAYSINMIGPPGVPIPVRRTSSYRVTTGSVAEDSVLRRIVSLEIDEATSQLLPTSGDSPSVSKQDCRTAAQPATTMAQR